MTVLFPVHCVGVKYAQIGLRLPGPGPENPINTARVYGGKKMCLNNALFGKMWLGWAKKNDGHQGPFDHG